MFTIDEKLCDAIRYGKFWIVKAWDKKTETTSWYVWDWQGDNELSDMTHIINWGTKYSWDKIEMIKERFEPYKNFKHLDYEPWDRKIDENSIAI